MTQRGDYQGEEKRKISQVATCDYGDKIEERFILALNNLGREFGEFKKDMKGVVKELKDNMEKITDEVFRRLPLWATWAFTIAGGIIGILVTLLTKGVWK